MHQSSKLQASIRREGGRNVSLRLNFTEQHGSKIFTHCQIMLHDAEGTMFLDSMETREREISVLICTHNPDTNFLERCLAALRVQTLPRDRWEILLIDNCSIEPVATRCDLSWHPHGRHLVAERIGKTHAIQIGVKQSATRLLTIVDDDNLLAPDYLENVRQIFEAYPFIGVAGGKIRGEYQTPPPAWTERYLPMLAIHDLGDRVLYTNTPDKQLAPAGAGASFRKVVMEKYYEQIGGNPLRQTLDPVGDMLSRAGDLDMAMTSWDCGLAKGYFPQLVLTHIIPPRRLELGYLVRLSEGASYSDTLLQLFRNTLQPEPKASLFKRLLGILRWRISNRHLNSRQLAVERARRRGYLAGHRTYLESLRKSEA